MYGLNAIFGPITYAGMILNRSADLGYRAFNLSCQPIDRTAGGVVQCVYDNEAAMQNSKPLGHGFAVGLPVAKRVFNMRHQSFSLRAGQVLVELKYPQILHDLYK